MVTGDDVLHAVREHGHGPFGIFDDDERRVQVWFSDSGNKQAAQAHDGHGGATQVQKTFQDSGLARRHGESGEMDQFPYSIRWNGTPVAGDFED